MKSLKLLILHICVCLAIYVNSVKCDEDDSLFQYDGETSMSNIDDANKEIYEDEISPLPDSGLVLEHEMIYEQSDQPVSGERFIAVRVDKMGATENLKPNLVGLSNMAIQFLPKDYKLVEVVEATREIVSGVRYELLVAALDATEEFVLCRIVVTEITWKLTAWGDKQRDLSYSNCTSNATTDDDNVPNSNDFNFNPLFVRKTNFINDDDLKLIESQILQPKQKEKTASKPKTSEMSDFDLSYLEAMIIPSKSSDKTKTLTKPQNDPNDYSVDFNTQDKVNHRDCNQPIEKEYLSKSQVLPETQLKTDFIDDATTNKNYEYSHQAPAKTLNAPTQSNNMLTDTEKPRIELSATESGQQDNISNGPVLEEIVLKSDVVVTESSEEKEMLVLAKQNVVLNNGTEYSDVRTNTEPTELLLTHTSPENQVTESALESLEEASTLLKISNENSERNEQDDQGIEQIQPKIESVSLKMEDSVVPSSETTVIFEKLTGSTEENNSGNEYSTESEKQENEESLTVSDRPKRAINTEMQFLEHLVEEALEHLDYVDSDNFKRVALDIIRVKKIEQENGAIYVIKVKTANSDCVEESDDHHSCLDNVIKDTTKICFIEIKSKRDVNTVTKSECSPDKKEITEQIRSKRETNEALGAPTALGAPFETKPEETEHIKQLVTTALSGLSQKPGSRNYGLHRIKSSQKQIVSGVLYKVDAEFILPNNDIKDCHIEIVVQEWIKPEPDVLQLNCSEDDEVTRKKRSLFWDSRLEEGDVQETEYDRNVSMLFDDFKIKFNKKYESAMEHSTRLRLFKHNLHVINELNRLEMGTATYGITEFADFTLNEYRQRTGLLRRTDKDTNEIPHPMAEIPDDTDLPTSFDWRDKGAVSEVKNQGSCGSCWAFSVIGNIEGLNAIKTGKLEEFSEQELVDCDTVDSGCNGGLPDNAYKAIEQIGGLETESEYPYDAKKSKCRFDPSLSHVKVSGAVDLPKNETAMALYLVKNGPLSIGINANAMQFYRGGISHPPRILCRHSSIDHGVLIVGYGVAEYPVFNKTLPYWIVKNSWGPSWGEKGYYRVFRGADTCGLSSMVSSAVLA